MSIRFLLHHTQMDITDMFGENADFSELLETREPLYVSSAVHKAFIAIDEEGSEAAAATGTNQSHSFAFQTNFTKSVDLFAFRCIAIIP